MRNPRQVRGGSNKLEKKPSAAPPSAQHPSISRPSHTSATEVTDEVKGRVTGSSRSCLHHLPQSKTSDLWTAPREVTGEGRALGEVTAFLKGGCSAKSLIGV